MSGSESLYGAALIIFCICNGKFHILLGFYPHTNTGSVAA